MKTSLPLVLVRATAVAALFVTVSLGVSRAAVAAMKEKSTPAPTAVKPATLPLEHTFAKATAGDNKGLYTLTLKNTSASAVKVTATIEESVVSHNRPKVRTLDPQVIEAGKTWKIEGLAAHDKVTIAAEGFEALHLTVP